MLPYTDNEQITALQQATEDRENIILEVVNLEPHTSSAAGGTAYRGVGHSPGREAINARFIDRRALPRARARNVVELDPSSPAHLFRLRQHARLRRDLDYYL